MCVRPEKYSHSLGQKSKETPAIAPNVKRQHVEPEEAT
jgi:hypothetical protein